MAEQAAPATGAPHRWRPVTSEAPLTRVVLTGVVLAFLGLFLVLPLAAVFAEALRKGGAAYLASFQDPDALAAIRLTLTVAAIAVPLNLVFGIAAAWAIANCVEVARDQRHANDEDSSREKNNGIERAANHGPTLRYVREARMRLAKEEASISEGG